jgi:hypothetical protein
MYAYYKNMKNKQKERHPATKPLKNLIESVKNFFDVSFTVTGFGSAFAKRIWILVQESFKSILI